MDCSSSGAPALAYKEMYSRRLRVQLRWLCRCWTLGAAISRLRMIHTIFTMTWTPSSSLCRPIIVWLGRWLLNDRLIWNLIVIGWCGCVGRVVQQSFHLIFVRCIFDDNWRSRCILHDGRCVCVFCAEHKHQQKSNCRKWVHNLRERDKKKMDKKKQSRLAAVIYNTFIHFTRFYFSIQHVHD